MPWLLESPENMSVCGSGQWHGTDCPPKTEGGGDAHTHSHPNNYSFSGAVSRLFRGPAFTVMPELYCTGHFPHSMKTT